MFYIYSSRVSQSLFVCLPNVSRTCFACCCLRHFMRSRTCLFWLRFSCAVTVSASCSRSSIRLMTFVSPFRSGRPPRYPREHAFLQKEVWRCPGGISTCLSPALCPLLSSSSRYECVQHGAKARRNAFLGSWWSRPHYFDR